MLALVLQYQPDRAFPDFRSVPVRRSHGPILSNGGVSGKAGAVQAPARVVPAIVWFVTVAETCLGVALIVGLFTRQSALASGVLLFLFSLGMTVGTGVKSALNASVFSASAAAFALAALGTSRWSVDGLRKEFHTGTVTISTKESFMSRI